MIPNLGLRGAAFAVFAGQCALSVTMFVVAQRAYRIEYETRRLVILAVIGVGLYALANMIGPTTGVTVILVNLVTVGSFPVILLAVGFLHRRELAEVRAYVADLTDRTRRAEPSYRDPTML